MTTLLISGSRNDNEIMKQFSWRMVERAKVNGYEIICGDAPGIDSSVWWACEQLEVPYTVWGFANEPRNNAPISNYKMYRDGRTFEQRDKFMVDSADRVLCIWNGEDDSRLVYEYAKAQGKDCWLYRFDGKRMTEVK